MITNPRFVTLYVRDQQKALEFWTEKVGFQLQTDAPYDAAADGARWIEVKAPRGDTYLVLHAVDEAHESLVGSLSHTWFQSDDLDATYEDLKAKGVEFSVPPSEAPWDPGSRWAQFSDPDGNQYGLS